MPQLRRRQRQRHDESISRLGGRCGACQGGRCGIGCCGIVCCSCGHDWCAPRLGATCARVPPPPPPPFAGQCSASRARPLSTRASHRPPPLRIPAQLGESARPRPTKQDLLPDGSLFVVHNLLSADECRWFCQHADSCGQMREIDHTRFPGDRPFRVAHWAPTPQRRTCAACVLLLQPVSSRPRCVVRPHFLAQATAVASAAVAWQFALTRDWKHAFENKADWLWSRCLHVRV